MRLDAFTHYYALEHLKKNHPSLVYIAYGETDDFAHDGDYEAYLKSAHTTDAMIGELWEFTQNDPFYKNNTLFIVTTDHGRGTDPLETWKGHGSDVEGAGEVAVAVEHKDIYEVSPRIDFVAVCSIKTAAATMKSHETIDWKRRRLIGRKASRSNE